MNVETKISPQNLLEEWGNFEDWESGAAAAPTEHILTGTDATIAREGTIVKQGSYSAAVTRVGNNATLYYDHPDFEDYQGRRVTFGCWVYATVASRARIGISDGVGSAQSSYHSGVTGWEFLTVSLNMAMTATRMRVEHQVNGGNTIGYFDGGILVEGDDLFTDLSNNSGFYISRIPSSKDIRISEYDPSRRHGIILGKPLFDKQTIKLTGQVKGSTPQQARDNLDTVKKSILSINNLRVDRGLRDLYLWDDRFLRGQPKGWDDDTVGLRHLINFNFDFVVPEPFEQAINRSRHVETISSSPDSFDITILGTIYSKPRIYFIADQGDDVGAITLENFTTREFMSYSDVVAENDTLVIDCHLETVENDGVDDLAHHVGDFITLLPGVNKLKFTGDNCTIKIDWFNRYL